MQTFRFQNRDYPYFVHTYNDTRHNERAVEVALAMALIKAHSGLRILEVGSVLYNYVNFKHDIVDKYDESGDPSIIKMDIVNYAAKEKYDLIVSISTFEHIGYDSGIEEKERGTGKISIALEHCKTLLKENGLMMITMPLGYNKELDQMLKDKKLAFDELYCMRRGEYNEWEQMDLQEALKLDCRREPCFLGTFSDVSMVVAYVRFLVIGFVHGKPEPKHYNLNFDATMGSGADV